jgi:hypothetical protein
MVIFGCDVKNPPEAERRSLAPDFAPQNVSAWGSDWQA